MELTKEWVSKRMPKRPKDAHKGTFGKVLAIAGSEQYPGAAYLSVAAAYRAGAGLVTLATIPVVQRIVGKKIPEVTFIVLPEEKGAISNLAMDVLYDKLWEYGDSVILVGPGLTILPFKFVNEIFKLDDEDKLIIDGDGLNILSEVDYWWESFEQHGIEVILTPHPGEMARLTGLSISKIQKDRENIALRYAEVWGQTVVLKGANTIIASPSGEALISPFANPALATAGTGDVLAGIIAGMLAQGLEHFEAAGAGVYIHGAAGEVLRKKVGEAGVLASDFLLILPQIIKDLV